MLPGMNPRQMQQAMKKLGIKQEDVEAIAVIIRTKEEDIIIRSPSVQRINMMGQISYQVAGEEEHRPIEDTISEDDIKTVMEQAGVSEEAARKAIEDAEGDLAQAIMSLSE